MYFAYPRRIFRTSGYVAIARRTESLPRENSFDPRRCSFQRLGQRRLLSHEADADEQLSRDDRVIGLEIDGDAIAYPLSAMGLREVANEEFGDLPVSVTWSPITYAARVYISIGPDGEPFTLAPTDQMVLNSPLLEAENGSRYLQFHGAKRSWDRTPGTFSNGFLASTRHGAHGRKHGTTPRCYRRRKPPISTSSRATTLRHAAGLFTQPSPDKRLPDRGRRARCNRSRTS